MVGSRRLIDLSGRVVAAAEACLQESQPVMVALSGGADSAVLLWAIIEINDSTRAVHINHGWANSTRLASAAERVSDHLDVALSTYQVDTSLPGSPEAVARRARYEALELHRREGEIVATAHTRTDQAETVVGNLMWGSGIDGLQGIRRRTMSLVRPILDIDRREVRELAVLLALPFFEDPANEDARYRRVRIRRALAAWESDLAPGVATRLASTADLVADDVEILERMAGVARIESCEMGVRISTGVLRSVDVAIGRRVVRRALRDLNGGMPGSQDDVEAVLAVAHDGSAREIAGGHRVERSGAFLHIGVPTTEIEATNVEWSVPGAAIHRGWRWDARMREGTPDVFPMSPWTQVFDARLFDDDGAVLRLLRDGDRIAIRGGHKSVRAAMAEAHVPSPQRGDWQALVVADELVWLPGVRRADIGWVSADTVRYLVISAEREGRWKPVEY